MQRKSVKDIIVEGLLVNEAHHKQWYFEQLLIRLGFDIKKLKEEVQKDGYNWEDGIPP